MIDDHDDLRRLHQGFLDAEHTSPGQRHDSQTILALLDENARLREALEFYAELSNYQSQQYTVTPNNPKISPWFFESTPVVQDDGNRARVALEEK